MSAWEPTIGASDEWYTPQYIFDALACEFDLDVAHPGKPDFCCVPANRWFSSDALTRIWIGFVWMNPPFGGRNSIEPWLEKFFAHGNGIALTPDRTSAPWFRAAWPHADAVMFLPKVKFIRSDGSVGKQPGNGTALWATGEKAKKALERAERDGLGILATPQVSARNLLRHRTLSTPGKGVWRIGPEPLIQPKVCAS